MIKKFSSLKKSLIWRNHKLSTNLRLRASFLYLLGFLLLLNPKVSEASQNQQQRWVGDVPIMVNLSVEPELGFSFDSPNGRIVMIFASSSVSEADIMGFYNQSLLAIGWTGGDGEWKRGSETLLISKVETATGDLWRLMLRPH